MINNFYSCYCDYCGYVILLATSPCDHLADHVMSCDSIVHIIIMYKLYVHTYLVKLLQHLAMLSLSLPVYQVRLDWLPLPCIALIRPSQLSCLGSSVGRASAS